MFPRNQCLVMFNFKQEYAEKNPLSVRKIHNISHVHDVWVCILNIIIFIKVSEVLGVYHTLNQFYFILTG